MNRKQGIAFLALLSMWLFMPASETAEKKPPDLHPVILKKVYTATFDEAWEESMTAIKEIAVETRFANKDARLMFAVAPGSGDNERYYLNIYLEPLVGNEGVVIYLVAHTWNGRYISEVESRFFNRLGSFLKEKNDGPR